MPITLKKDVWKVKDPSSGQYRGAAILSTTLPQDAAQIISESNDTIQNIKDTAIDAVDTALNDESTGLIPKAEADRDAIDDSLNNVSNGIIPTAQSDRDDIDDSLNNTSSGIIPEAQANLATIAAAVQSQIGQGTDKTLSVAKGFADAKAAGMMVKVSNYQPGSALDDPATSQDASQNTGYPVYKDSNRVWVKETYAELEVPTMDDVDELKSAFADYAETGELRTLLTDSNTLDKKYYWTGNSGDVLTKSSYNVESVYTASPIDVSEYDYVLVQLSSANMSGGRRIGFCNAENIISTVWRENGFVTTYNDKTGMYEKLLATNGQTHFFFSYSRTVATNIKIYGIKTYYSGDDIVYVSPIGSDINTGTENSPLKTINKALEKGAKTVLLAGGTYLQTIDLSKSKYALLTMKPLNGSNTVVFKDADCIIGESANSVSGYTNVKSITTQKTLASSNKWIWQEGVNDSKSLISDAWRHPLQRGQGYRCTDTRIVRSNQATLSDALTDIEASASNGTYKWYYESGVLYFASPSEVTSEHPICCSNGARLFNNTPEGFTLNVTGVSSKYLIFDVSNTENTTLTDCKAENVYGAGAFIYNNCISVKFIKCEANSCVTGENGDGFNGHASIDNSPFTKQCTALFVDCWAHDNNDDGYSDHERAETTIIGGLFESNNKGGVVPSYGSHLTCYNVIARGNYSGFLCAGTAEQAEGGKYTQMLCYNCLSYNNERGGKKSGFCVEGENNKMTLIGCKSIHNTYGYTAYASSNIAELIDCSASENTVSVTNGSGTFDIKNTIAVTM